VRYHDVPDVVKIILWNGMIIMTNENSFGAIIAAKVRETDEAAIKEEIWNRFMENMKHVVKHDEEPIHVLNFLGSVKKHKIQFMKIDISDLTK
jgi:hypothetical protein